MTDGIHTPDLPSASFIDSVVGNRNAGAGTETVRVSFNALAAQIAAYVELSGSVVFKTTKALLDADLAHAAGAIAFVYDDATPANNGVYRKTGASGAGFWTRESDLIIGVLPEFSATATFTTDPNGGSATITGSRSNPVIELVVPRGTIIWSTSGAPSNSLGVNGDYAIDPSNYTLYGPKAGGVWPAPSATAQSAAAAAAASAALADTRRIAAETALAGAQAAAASASAFDPQGLVVAADAAALRAATPAPNNNRIAFLQSTRRFLRGATGLAAGTVQDDGLAGVRPAGGNGSAGWIDFGDRPAIWHENVAEAAAATHPVGNFLKTAYRDQFWGGGGAVYARSASTSAGGFTDAGGVHWRLLEGPNGWDVAAVCPCLTNAGRFLETTAERTLAFPDGAIVYVMNDPTAADRGVWQKSGAPGSGSWTKLTAFQDAQPLLQAFIEEKSGWVQNYQNKTHIAYWFGSYTLVMPSVGLKIRQYRTWLRGCGALIDGQGTGGSTVGAGVAITHDGSVNSVLYTNLEGITVRRMSSSGWRALNASYIHARECYGDENGANGFSFSVGVSNMLVDCGAGKNTNAGYLEQASVIGPDAFNTLYTKLVRFQAHENTQFGIGFYESANAELYECRVELNGNLVAGRRGVTLESCNRMKIVDIYTELQAFDIYVTTGARIFDGSPGRPLQGSNDISIINPNMGGEAVSGSTPTNIFVNNTNGVELRGGRCPANVDFQSGGGNTNVSINNRPEMGPLLAAGVQGLRFDGVRTGTITLSNTETFKAHLFSAVPDVNEPTGNYDLWFEVDSVTGTPATAAYTLRQVTSKSAGGFQINGFAPGAGASVTFRFFARSRF